MEEEQEKVSTREKDDYTRGPAPRSRWAVRPVRTDGSRGQDGHVMFTPDTEDTLLVGRGKEHVANDFLFEALASMPASGRLQLWQAAEMRPKDPTAPRARWVDPCLYRNIPAWWGDGVVWIQPLRRLEPLSREARRHCPLTAAVDTSCVCV